MSGDGSYPVGSLVRVSAAFTDASGAAVDPTTVTLQVKTPAGTVTSYVDPDVVHDGVGLYHYDIDGSTVGNWEYRWSSTGTGQAAEESSFTIEHTEF